MLFTWRIFRALAFLQYFGCMIELEFPHNQKIIDDRWNCWSTYILFMITQNRSLVLCLPTNTDQFCCSDNNIYNFLNGCHKKAGAEWRRKASSLLSVSAEGMLVLRVQYSFRNACHSIKRRSKNLIKSHFVVLFSYLFELLHSIFTQHYKRFSFMSCHTLRLKVKITLTTALWFRPNKWQRFGRSIEDDVDQFHILHTIF